MKRLFTIFLILSGLIFPQQLPKYAPGQAIVIFDQIAYSQIQNDLLQESLITSNPDANQLFSSLQATRIQNILQKDSFDSIEEESGLNRSFVIYFPAYTDAEVENAVNDLKKSYLIEDAFPNVLGGYELIEPNDPKFNNQSNLERIKMPQAWDIQKGNSDIRIVILEAGFQPTHQEIAPKIYLQKDFVDIDFSNYPNWEFDPNEDYQVIDDDATGVRIHGTQVAQVAAAATNNDYGIAGVGWNTPLVLVRCGFQATTPQGSVVLRIETDDIINAVNWIRTSSNAKVVNISIGWASSPSPLLNTALTNCINSGIVIVAAAGNDGGQVMYPASYPGVIAVSGVNSDDLNSGFNVGPQLSVVAPANGFWMSSEGDFVSGSGTSLAAPLVAGSAALILSQNPNLTPQVVKRVIESSAFKVPGMGGQIFHNSYGYGRLDVYEALRALNSIYVFKNVILGNNDYGFLTIDNDINHPVPSNSVVPVKYEANHTSRTNELPFLVNYSGTTQKFNKWYQTNSDYNLQLSFIANSQTPPIKDAIFEATVSATITNGFLESSSLNPVNDNVLFNDPWFYYQDVNNNWIQSNDFKTYSSPFYIQNNVVNSYGGVFLNQLIQLGTYYKAFAEDQEMNITGIGTRNFYFQNWSTTGGASLETYSDGRGAKIVFTAPEATIIANYKGTQLSKDQSAYASGSQRKIIRVVKSGAPTTLHAVYESNGYCWYEMSSDNGQTWEIMNDGKPLSFAGYGDLGKGPSIEYSSSQGVIYIVWQGKNSFYNENRILFASFMPSSWYSTNYELQYLKIISPELNYSYEQLDANPVLAVGKYNWGLVVWKGTYNDNILNLKYKLGWFTSDFSTRSSGVIPQTDSYSLNPSIFGNKSGTIDDIFHLVYQKSFEIYYRKITHSENQVNFNDPDFIKLSENNGFAKNYNPSITGCFEGNNSYPKISWIAFRKTYIPDNPQGGQQSLGETKVFCRSKNAIGWSAFSSYGSSINSVNINYNNDNTFAIAWSEALTSNFVNKFVRSDYPTEIYLANTSGKNLQVVNYDNLNNMRLNSFTTSTTPYSFSLSNTFYVIPHDIQYYMDGNIVQDTTTFYFRLGDILVGGQQVKFEDLPDGISIPDYETLNSYFVSRPFALTDNIDFIYSVEYGVTDSLSAVMLLQDDKFAHFKVELIDDQSNELLGTFDDVTYNSENIMLYEKIAYQVNTQGIGNRICRLRLVTEDDLGLHYSISNCYNDQTDLGKLNLVQITIDGVGVVKTYAMEQNFPNPFNPTTVIKYQIPKAGNVVLKVYDILGSELATLVDEQKNEGRYEVNFDASNLASGVYIYRLSVNDFVNVKKMVLLK